MSGPLWGEEHSFDPLLLSMMESCGKVQNFLDSIFSFLSRRTDFYILMDHDESQMGFKPGAAMNMVIQAFKKYEILTRKKEAELQREAETRRIDLMTDDLSKEPLIDVGHLTKEELSKLEKLKTVLPSEMKTQKKETSKPRPKKPKQESPPPATPTSDISSVEESTTTTVTPSVSTVPKKTEEEPLQLSSDAYNGSKTDKYVWCQTVTDLDLRVTVPFGTPGKNLKVDIKSDSLKVEVLRPEREVVLYGRLLHRCKVEESLWTIHKGDKTTEVHINLEKTKEVMWKSVFEGEDGIDLSRIDNSRNIGDFDQEAQVAIERVTYDHHMKMIGKPTSSEQKAHDILRKAWDAPGSPFAGTPFDPSRVNVTGVW